MKILTLLLLFLVASITTTAAQKSAKNGPTLSLSVFNENFGLNAFPQGNPLHLGGALAVAFTKKENRIYRKKHAIELGYFKHDPIFQAVYLAWKPTYQWQFNNGFQVHSILGLGYLHSLPTQTTFVQDNGIYVAKNHHGKYGGMGTFGVGIGFQFNPSVTLFARQEWTGIAPFNINNSFPGGTLCASFGIGMSIQL